MRILTALLALLFSSPLVNARTHTGANPPAEWHANWIAMPGEDGRDYGVYYFRKSIELGAKPDHFIVHVSADNRYKLFVNGTLVSLGPARNDTYHWNYETVDLAPIWPRAKTWLPLWFGMRRITGRRRRSAFVRLLLYRGTRARKKYSTPTTAGRYTATWPTIRWRDSSRPAPENL
ncbi:hypothetical protein ACQ86N_00470 [Puia sp. P3]|uniref:hypothetical protein n=1 Tax=Puia sp. P3 TaxID=3423952 RepID=UPI003D66A580